MSLADRLPLRRELHTGTRASMTAQWTALGRALELERPPEERIVSDVHAPVFLSAINHRVLGPLRSAAPLVHVAERSALVGIGTSALCRHRFIDAQLLTALPEVEQIVVLGAGYDSRAYRYTRAIGERTVYEVDLAPISRRKAAVVRAHPELFGRRRVTRVEIDFRTDSLRATLARSGLILGAPTFVAWEGVSMYLTRAAVADTLDALAAVCGRGSVVAMDFWRPSSGLRPTDQMRRAAVRSMRLIGEPITFSIAPDQVSALLGQAGFDLAQVAASDRLTRRYATAGRRCDQGLYVVAGNLR